MGKLFALSLKGKALEWYRLLDNSHMLDWEEIKSLFYSKFYPLHEVHENRNYVYNFYPHDGESIEVVCNHENCISIDVVFHLYDSNV